MSTPASTSPGRKALKIAGIIVGCLLGLLLILSLLLLTLLEPYVARHLQKQVVEKTHGLYTISFDDMQLNLLNGSLAFKNMHILPDTTTHRQLKKQKKAKPMLLDLQAPAVEIAGVKLINTFFSKKLIIGKVELIRPHITLYYDKSIQPDPANDKKKPASNFVESVRIGEINIQDATFSQVRLAEPKNPRHQIRQLTFRVHDLLLDSLDQQNQTHLFEADDMQISVRDYAYSSPDGVYLFQVGNLDYASKKGDLLLRKVRLRADKQANIALEAEKSSPAIYDISAPLLRVTGLDLIAAYRTKQLRVKQIELERPSLAALHNPALAASQDTLNLAAIYKNTAAYLRLLSIGELQVSDASLALRQQLDTVHTIHQLDKITMAIRAIQIDSSTLFSPKENFFAETIHFVAKDYAYQHPNSPYTLQAGSVELNTKDNSIQASAIQLRSDPRKNDRLKKSGNASATLYAIHAPRVSITETNLIHAYKTGKLAIGSIQVYEPDIKVLQDQQVERVDLKKLLQKGYPQISGIFTQLTLGELNVQDAAFSHQIKKNQLTQRQQLKHISLVATGLKIDSAFVFNPDQKIPIEDITVAAADYTFRLPDNPHTFTFGNLRYSTRKQELTAQRLKVHASQEENNQLKPTAKARRLLFDVEARQLRVTGLDLLRAYNTGSLQINRLILSHPNLAILQDNDVAATPAGQQKQQEYLTGILKAVAIRKIYLNDGTFTYHDKRGEIVRTQVLEHASASVTELHLTPARLANLSDSLPLQEFTLSASDYTFRSPDSLYTLKLGSLQYSSRQQELIAQSIDIISDKEAHKRLKQENEDKANRNIFDISADQFRITGLDLIRAYGTGKFSMGEIRLLEPQVGILQDHTIPAATQGKVQVPERLNEIVDKFRAQNIHITNGTFLFNILEDSTLRSQTIKNVSVSIADFRVADLQASDPMNMFRVDDIGILIHDYTFNLPDSLYQFQIGRVRTSLQEKAVYIDSLKLVPLYSKEEFAKKLSYADDRYEVTVPEIQLQGADLAALYNYQHVIVQKVLLHDLVADVYRDNRTPQDPNRRPPTLQQMIREAQLRIIIDTVLLKDSKLTYSEIAPTGIAPGSVLMNELKLEILNVTNDEARIRENNLTTAHGSTLFLGESTLDVHFSFHLDHPDDLYSFEGTLDTMKFEAFNPLVENLMFVRAEDGHINKAAFAVTATKDMAEGQIDFYYEDLKIQLLDKHNKAKPGLLLNAGSWLLNNLVIKSDNPAGKRPLREGPIKIERNYQKSVFNHMSKALMDGITSSFMTPLVEEVVGVFIPN